MSNPVASAGTAENVFLIGLMGAGKTSVGRFIAGQLNKRFYDCDHEIERRTGVRIPEIFEIEGEAGFRTREIAVLRELTAMDNIVLATGGGAVLSKENRRLLNENGTVVYLCATPEALWHRTRHDRNRPLLQNPDPRATLDALFRQRDPLYRETAHLVIDTGKQSVKALGQALEKQLHEYWQSNLQR